MSYKVDFKDVGRNKASFERDFDHEPTELDLIRAVMPHLMSGTVQCYGGKVIVGGFRTVGEYDVYKIGA